MKSLTSMSAVRIFIALMVNFSLYLAFAANLGIRELVAGAAVAVIATVATFVFASAGRVDFRFRLYDVMQAWRMPWYVIDGTVEVLHGMAKQLFTRGGAPSFLAAVPFDVGRPDSLIDAGRRALEITYTTSTPNFIILGIIQQQKLLLYHQIVPGKVLTMTRNLGTRA